MEALCARTPPRKCKFFHEGLRSFTSCLVRQVNEAVRIEMSTADCLMNRVSPSSPGEGGACSRAEGGAGSGGAGWRGAGGRRKEQKEERQE